MGNKGFTLIEVLGSLCLISIIIMVAIATLNSTLSVTREESYKLMKNNIISVSYDYVNECDLGLLTCDFSFEYNNKFSAEELRNAGFVKSLESPIDGHDLGTCLILEATKSNGVTVVDLIDNCY